MTSAGFTSLTRVAETPFNIVLEAKRGGAEMKFSQIIEFSTDRIDQFNAELDAWQARTEGKRIPHRATLSRDRDTTGRHLLIVEFASYEQGRENSDRPETADFAAFLSRISNSPLTFRNLDVIREEDF